jgi:hypothetical protein
MLYLEQSHVVMKELRSSVASGWTAWKRDSMEARQPVRLVDRSFALSCAAVNVDGCGYAHVHTWGRE